MTGKYHTKYKKLTGQLSLEAPDKDAVTQGIGYKKDTLKMFPEFKITACIIYVAANKGFNFFTLGYLTNASSYRTKIHARQLEIKKHR